ncbi:hypothetical protein [Pseudomonas syringae]|uniref:Uncharacterized protein n=1 Tax=Pseudomonas syringae TaxID=317 RepID=A0A085UQN3_PSESX|nr:hypothetical protein [Pseudomonas syringae]KFE45496.1 hypothetical protein IV02_27140 [Pseudomonas syringae]
MSHAPDIRSTFEFREGGVFAKDPGEIYDLYAGSTAHDVMGHAQDKPTSGGLLWNLYQHSVHPHPVREFRSSYTKIRAFGCSISRKSEQGSLVYVTIARESIEPLHRVAQDVQTYFKEASWVHIQREWADFSFDHEQSDYDRLIVAAHCGVIHDVTPKLTSRFHRAFARLSEFYQESVGWDGNGGRPASKEVFVETSRFLSEAEEAGLEQPSLVMGNDGSVATVWQNDELYITAVFSGVGDYIYVVSRIPEIVASGSHSGGGLAAELFDHLSEYSREDGKSGL